MPFKTVNIRIEALTEWLATHEHMTLLTNKEKLKGKTVSTDTFQKSMRAALKEAGLKGTLHGLRYTTATRAYELT
ncbi:hypothetical protein [Kiloniella sp. EL199]|uniref:hypothetical protein n=1 Tax=Kiloniella sp. EL199 TaxID=2107581 RepID=UPI0013C4709E|nr:hypothetical protein [Kiloniella sp. EL199]